MSTETEEQIIRQMEEQTNTIEACQVRLGKLKDTLAEVKALAKKPELDLGFGDILTDNQMCRILAFGTHRGEVEQKMTPCDKSGKSCSDFPHFYKRIGNIFNLLEQAGDGGVPVALTKDEAEHFAGCNFSITAVARFPDKVRAALDKLK